MDMGDQLLGLPVRCSDFQIHSYGQKNMTGRSALEYSCYRQMFLAICILTFASIVKITAQPIYPKLTEDKN